MTRSVPPRGVARDMDSRVVVDARAVAMAVTILCPPRTLRRSRCCADGGPVAGPGRCYARVLDSVRVSVAAWQAFWLMSVLL